MRSMAPMAPVVVAEATTATHRSGEPSTSSLATSYTAPHRTKTPNRTTSEAVAEALRTALRGVDAAVLIAAEAAVVQHQMVSVNRRSSHRTTPVRRPRASMVTVEAVAVVEEAAAVGRRLRVATEVVVAADRSSHLPLLRARGSLRISQHRWPPTGRSSRKSLKLLLGARSILHRTIPRR